MHAQEIFLNIAQKRPEETLRFPPLADFLVQSKKEVKAKASLVTCQALQECPSKFIRDTQYESSLFFLDTTLEKSMTKH